MKDIVKEINKLGFEVNVVLDLIEISGGLYKPDVALLIAKGLCFDALQKKFDMLESEYYRIREEFDRANLEIIEKEV